MFIINHKKIFITLSALAVIASIVAISTLGLSLGIDFTGGSVLQVSYPAEHVPAKAQIDKVVETVTEKGYLVRQLGNDAYSIKTEFLNENDHQTLLKDLTFDSTFTPTQDSFSSVGPSIGSELRDKALVAIIIVVLAIVLFIAFSFRKVSKPVSSWMYGLVAVIALVHDVIIPIGLFALLGHFIIAEVNILFITALLAILGYSINDTIVVFDRIRENLRHNEDEHTIESFNETVGRSITQTMARSINTAFTTLLALSALYFFGGVTTHNFALVLIVGIVSGTYSSIFLASSRLCFLTGTR